MIDLIVWIAMPFLGAGGLKSAEVYLRHRTKVKTPELTEQEKFEKELFTPFYEPEKTLPEHCSLFTERIFEKRLVEAGIIRKEEMSVCLDGMNCPECKETVEYKNRLEKVKRDMYLEKAAAKEKALEAKRAEEAEAARKRKYHNERWQEVTNGNGVTRGYIHQIKDGAWEFEAAGTGKTSIISAADARRYCKACWTPLRHRVCERGCPQPVPDDRKRAVEGYMVVVPDQVPFDAFGKVDRDYNNTRFFSVYWKWINPENGKEMGARSMHPKTGFEGKEPTAIERAELGKASRTHNQQKQMHRRLSTEYGIDYTMEDAYYNAHKRNMLEANRIGTEKYRK